MQSRLAAQPALTYCDLSGEWPLPAWIWRMDLWIDGIHREAQATLAKEKKT